MLKNMTPLLFKICNKSLKYFSWFCDVVISAIFHEISKNITDAIALGSYTFSSLKDRALWILLACRKIDEGIEIGYFGGNRNCEGRSMDFGFKTLKRETLSTFHDKKFAKMDHQRLERLKYHDCQMPLFARDFCSTHTVFFWFVWTFTQKWPSHLKFHMLNAAYSCYGHI